MFSVVDGREYFEQFVRRLRIVMPLVLLLGAIFSGSVLGQGVQVPFDRDSTVYTIDPDLRAQLGLFSGVSAFQGAELYRVDSTTYELVVRVQEAGRVRRDRRTLSAAQVESLREKIARGRSGGSKSHGFTQAGRYDLIAATTAHGFTEGALLASAFGAEDDALALLSLGGSVGFFVPLLATRKTRVTEAEADMTFYGGVQGYAHAVQLTQILGGGDVGGRATAGIAAVAGAIEGTVAYRVARLNTWSGVYSEMVLYNGLAGNFIGAGVGGTIVGNEGSSRVVAGMSLLGSIGGAYLGHQLGRTGRYTAGDLRVYVQSSLWATYLGSAILTEQEHVSLRGASALFTGSVVGGAWIGNQLVRNRDFTRPQSEILGLGGIAGLLAGGAIGELADTEESGLEEFSEFHLVDEALGAAVGFSVAYAMLEEDARRQASENTSAVTVDVRVSPTMAGGPGAAGGSTEVVPRVSLTATF